MTSQTWYEPPNGVPPVVGDIIWTPVGKMTLISIIKSDGTRYLLRLTGDDPQPAC